MIKVSARTFFTPINLRPSDLYCNLHTALRFYKNNNNTVRMTQD